VGVKCNKVIVLLASWVLVVGFSAPVFAGVVLPDCDIGVEINALRGGAGHALSGGTKDITSKARIVKGSAPLDATLSDTTLTITQSVGALVIQTKDSTGITLVVGKGGQGDKLRFDVPVCAPGQAIDYVSHFSGTSSTNGAICEVTSGVLTKTCK
jgi:hypothetical protein